MCVFISERMFVLNKAFVFSLCCGTKEEALDVPVIVEVIFHSWVAYYGWQWVPVHNCSLDKSQLSNLLWHINPGRRSVSVCAGAQYLQSQLFCVHQGALETTDPLELLQHSRGWYFVHEGLCAREAAPVSDTKHPLLCSPSFPFTAVPQVTSLEFIIPGEQKILPKAVSH